MGVFFRTHMRQESSNQSQWTTLYVSISDWSIFSVISIHFGSWRVGWLVCVGFAGGATGIV